jgi:ATP phosphoribosyltransferase
MASISIALSKGRIFDETAPLLARAGIRPKQDPEQLPQAHHRHEQARRALDRESALPTPHLTCSMAAPISASPAATCSSSTAARASTSRSTSTSPKCRMVVAVRKGFDYAGAVRQGARLRVATKYVRTTREHFGDKGVHVDLIRLYGSMELAPLTGPRRRDRRPLVATGKTLKANGLVAVEEIMQVSARLIVNQRR